MLTQFPLSLLLYGTTRQGNASSLTASVGMGQHRFWSNASWVVSTYLLRLEDNAYIRNFLHGSIGVDGGYLRYNFSHPMSISHSLLAPLLTFTK